MLSCRFVAEHRTCFMNSMTSSNFHILIDGIRAGEWNKYRVSKDKEIFVKELQVPQPT